MNEQLRPDEQQIRVAITGLPDVRDLIFENLEGVVVCARRAGTGGADDQFIAAGDVQTFIEFFVAFAIKLSHYIAAAGRDGPSIVRQATEAALDDGHGVTNEDVTERVLRP